MRVCCSRAVLGLILGALLVLLSLWPLAVIGAGRLSRHEDPGLAALGRLLGCVLLHLSFNLSFATIWGALVLRRSPELVPWLFAALVIAQPFAAHLSWTLAGRAR